MPLMRRGLFLGILALLAASVGIYFALSSKHALVVHPKGLIANLQLKVILVNLFLMALVIVPTFVCLYLVAWKYRFQNKKASYEPEKKGSRLGEILVWLIPIPSIAIMIVWTWDMTHKLDPYVPIPSEKSSLHIQVMALDWKWLFIYPEQGIATLNFVQFPEQRPVHFSLAADGSPMNSFWIPQLSGQIYSMTGMITQLHIMASEAGEYAGKAVEINGEGYAGMTFVAKATSQTDFDQWVSQVKTSPLHLTQQSYNHLLTPTVDHPVAYYSHVEKGLFEKMVMKYMHPPKNS